MICFRVNFTLEVDPTPSFYCFKLKYLGPLCMLTIASQFRLAAYRIKPSSLWLATCLLSESGGQVCVYHLQSVCESSWSIECFCMIHPQIQSYKKCHKLKWNFHCTPVPKWWKFTVPWKVLSNRFHSKQEENMQESWANCKKPDEVSARKEKCDNHWPDLHSEWVCMDHQPRMQTKLLLVNSLWLDSCG
jgi:hypothetical protein